jgi:eukaryotic-like serine/threonine-protein kinase
MHESREGEVDGLPLGTQVGDWRVRALIAVGGTSAVYEVDHVAGDKCAALKVMLADDAARAHGAERFSLEANVIREIDHPGVPEVFELGRLADGRPYLVMELLRGRTLGAVIERERTPLATAITILEQLCDVLAVAHSRGVVHRDLKPDNVVVLDGDGDGGPAVKLLDWGIAKLFEDHLPGSTLTSTGAIVGTPRYLAPEQARSQHVDARTDIYSLGLVAYELLLGAYPFETTSSGEALMNHMIQPPRAPRRFWPEIPPELERVLLGMLAKDPARRPALTVFAHSLRIAAGAVPPLPVEPEAAKSERDTARCHRLRRN